MAEIFKMPGRRVTSEEAIEMFHALHGSDDPLGYETVIITMRLDGVRLALGVTGDGSIDVYGEDGFFETITDGMK